MKHANIARPRTFTAAEDIIEYLSIRVISDQKTYRKIAEGVGVSQTTIAHIANRTTRWPRPTTLFPLLAYYNIKLRIEE